MKSNSDSLMKLCGTDINIGPCAWIVPSPIYLPLLRYQERQNIQIRKNILTKTQSFNITFLPIFLQPIPTFPKTFMIMKMKLAFSN